MTKRWLHHMWCAVVLICFVSSVIATPVSARKLLAASDQTENSAETSGTEESEKHHKHKHEEKESSESPGANLAPCISWVNPLVPPKVALLCIHGLGLYSGSYQDFGTRMARVGIATFAIDVRGFGSWMK